MAQTQGPTFEEIFAAPDDAKLNIDYAIAQANAGNLLTASATLERVLINHPDLQAARLLRATILYRLEDYQGAAAELKLINGAQLTPVQQRENARYRALIDGQRAPAKVSGRFSTGLAYDSDATGALNAILPAGAPTSSGLGATVSLRLDGTTKVGTSDYFKLFGALGLYDRSTLSGPSNDIALGELAFGLEGTWPTGSWRVGGAAREYHVLSTRYLDEYGGMFESRWRVNPATTWVGTLEVANQDFDEPAVDALAATLGGTRDGMRYSALVSVSHRLSSHTNVWGGVGYELKAAGYNPFGYRAPRVTGGIGTTVGRATLSVSGDVRTVTYDGIDTFFLGAQRKETRSRGRLALAAPLSAFTAEGATGDARDNISLEGALIYNRRDVHAPLTNYDSLGGELTLVWRFGARQ